jgi:hypothetical protein
MACEVRSMNKFRSAVLSGKGLHGGTPVVADKQARGAEGDKLASVEIERHDSRTADHRGGDRHRLTSESATIRYKGRDRIVDLVNLSGGGAMIEASFEPYLWERIDLSLGAGQSLECAVRWVRGGRIGLEFAHETTIDCDAATRDRLLLATINKSFPQVAKLADPDTAAAVPAAPEPRADDHRRAEKRHPLIWSGQIHWNHDSHKVRLRNIGTTGALVEGIERLHEGAELMLDLGEEVQIFATVVWSRGDKAGLSFIDPFDLALLAKAQPEVAQQSWVPPTYLDSRLEQGDPWDAGWNRTPLDQLQRDLDGFLKR